jgi:flagellar protein FliO/FliZ
METFFSGLLFLVIFGSILFLAFAATKFIGTKTGNAMKGRHISIVETVSLGLDSKLHLVKIGEEYILISSSGKNIQLLKTLQPESHPEEADSAPSNMFNFKDIFEKYVHNFKKVQNGKTDIKSEEASGNTSLKGDAFKSNLIKLKTITTGIVSHKTYDGDENTNENTNEN